MEKWKKKFIIIFGGQVASILTSSIIQFTIIWYLTFTTESATVLAISTIVSIMPQVLIGPFAGVVVDRLDRKKIMILADGVIAIATLLLGIMFFTGTVNLAAIYIIIAIRAIGSAFHAPSFQASIPLLAPEDKIVKIAGINQTISASCNIIGPIVGGILFGILPIGLIMIFDVIGAAIAIISLLFVSIPKIEVKKRKVHVLKEMKEGFFILKKERDIFNLTIFMTIVCILYMPISSLYPLMTKSYFNLESIHASIAQMSFAIGLALGGVGMTILSNKNDKIKTIVLATFILGIAILLDGFLPLNAFWLFVILALIIGTSGTIFAGLYTAILQIRISPEALGRVFSLTMSLMMLGTPIGLIFAAPVAEKIGITPCFLIIGILIVISCIFMYVKNIRANYKIEPRIAQPEKVI